MSFTNNDADENPFNFRITGTVNPLTAPEVEVRGNNVVLVDGDTTPALADHTDFGTNTIGTPVSRVFTVKNLGTAVLTTAGLTVPSGYSVLEGLSPSLAVGGQDTFTVRLNATAAGTFAGEVSFTNNDADESPFNFRITGTVDCCGGGIEMRGNNVVIVDGDTTPALADHTDFGTTPVGTPVSRVFTVKNLGTAVLTTAGLTVPAGYSVLEGLSPSIAAGGQDTFTVRLNATALGVYPGDVSFTNNDPYKNPFNFRITGTVGAPPVLTVTPASQNFGSIRVRTTADRNFTIQNTSSSSLSGSATVPGPFSIVSGGTYNLGTGVSQIVTVRYSPTGTGPHSNAVTFTVIGASSVRCPVTGTSTNAPTAAAMLAMTPGAVLEPHFANGVFSVTLPTVAGRTYIFESTSAPSTGPWLPLVSLIGNGEQMRMDDYTASGQQRFYRVREE